MKIRQINRLLLVPAIVGAFALWISAQQKPDAKETNCPMMNKADMKPDGMPVSNHANHYDSIMKNGEKEMGFSQTATTHHFLLMDDGGAIQVEANDAKDTENRNNIRMHLAEITKEFQKGIFTTPFAVHGQVPPGVPLMDELKDNIKYTYKQTDNGARVRISTSDPKALAAIHDFLKFQIEEHRTGDSVK